MNSTDLLITISGPIKSGKSGLAFAIQNLLEKQGIKVELIDDNGVGIVDELPDLMKRTFGQRAMSISNRGAMVHVQTICLKGVG